MIKRHHQNRKHLTAQGGTSISVEPEAPEQLERQAKAAQSERKSPGREEIQKLAYQIHQQKGGSDFENWLEAEKVLKQEHEAASR